MTVLDTSVVVDYLLGAEAATGAARMLFGAGPAAAPDLLVFEILAVFRREVGRGELTEPRARSALDDLGDLAVELFPTLPLRERAFDLRANLTAADGLFVALAEQLDEPLATKDRGLASAAAQHSAVEVVLIG